jgi:hypothetical protein
MSQINGYTERLTPASKRMKNGKSHPWRARGGTTKEQKDAALRQQTIVGTNSNLMKGDKNHEDH